MNEIVDGFNAGNPISFEGEPEHVVCSIIKLFFRSLQSPIIPFEVFEEALEISRIHKLDPTNPNIIIQTKTLIEGLPTVNSFVLHFFIRFLCKIASLSSFNQMNTSNLASVLAPTLLYRKDVDQTKIMEDSLLSIIFIQLLLDNVDFVFQNAPSTPAEVSLTISDAEKICQVLKFSFEFLVNNKISGKSTNFLKKQLILQINVKKQLKLRK